jgi:hypothetical protein
LKQRFNGTQPTQMHIERVDITSLTAANAQADVGGLALAAKCPSHGLRQRATARQRARERGPSELPWTSIADTSDIPAWLPEGSGPAD